MDEKINKNSATVISVNSYDADTSARYSLNIGAYLGHLSINVFKNVDNVGAFLFRRSIQPFIAMSIIPKKLEKLLKMEPGGSDSFNLLDYNQEDKKFNIGFTMSFKKTQDNKQMIVVSEKDKDTVKLILQMPPRVDLTNVSEHNKNNEYIEGLIHELKYSTNRAITSSLLLMKK